MDGEIKKLEKITKETLDLLSAYKKAGLTLPFGLKGNIGEFLVAVELMKRFPNSKINFKGGANPAVDIFIDGKKIQVKTSFGHEIKRKTGTVRLEICPTVKRKVFKNKLCDYLILVVISLARDYSSIENMNIYIFDDKDFKYFNPALCWSGKSKGDLTIANIVEINGILSEKLNKEVSVYNTSKYRSLFKAAKDNWGKI